VNRIAVRLAGAMLLVAVVSLLAVPLATSLAERSAYDRLPDALRDRVEAFSRPEPLLPRLRDWRNDTAGRGRTMMPGMPQSGMPMMESFEGEAARLAILVRDLRELRRNAVLLGVAIALVASVLLAWALARGLARPIEAVSRAAGRVAGGDLSARAEVPNPSMQPVEVRALARDFDDMATSLEQLEAERASMIADVAHELRNPLATLTLRLEAASDGLVELDRAEAETLLAQTHLLSRLVSDLRMLSQADAGRLALAPDAIDLRGPIQDAVAAHRPAGERRGVAVTAELPTDPLTIVGDRDRLLQVLHNLIENALRVAPEDSEVRVVAEERDGVVRVRVRDHGPGIALDPPEAIFDRFVREQRRDTRGGAGSGLGLSIVRTLVELHGGSVHAERTGDATEIGFDLPRAAGTAS